jgi:hypothetical protein
MIHKSLDAPHQAARHEGYRDGLRDAAFAAIAVHAVAREAHGRDYHTRRACVRVLDQVNRLLVSIGEEPVAL